MVAGEPMVDGGGVDDAPVNPPFGCPSGRRPPSPLLCLVLVSSAAFGCGGTDASTGPSQPPPTGIVEVTVSTAGTDVDLDGYAIAVGNQRIAAAPLDGTRTVTLRAGTYQLLLEDVAGNCEVTGQNHRTVTVPEGETVEQAFRVACADLPSLRGQIVVALCNWLPSTRRSFERGIFAMDPDGGNLRRLTTEEGWAFQVSVSPDGKRFLVSRNTSPGGEIWLVNADGTEEPGAVTGGQNPAWSPDGSRFAFSNRGTGERGAPDIVVMRPDGTVVRQVTRTPWPEQQPSWSPDGTRIAFARGPTEGQGIYVANLESGGDPVRLTNPTSGLDFQPRWSPDGTRIAFSSSRTGRYHMYLMDADGSNVVQLTPGTEGYDEFAGAWSPDGTMITYKRMVFTDPVGRRSDENDPEIHVIRIDGSERLRLTDNEFDEHSHVWVP